MIINVVNEVLNLENGTYTAEISAIAEYNENRVLVKFTLGNGTVFLKFCTENELGSYPWNNIFRALNTDDTNDLIGQKVEFEISNKTSEKTGYEFSNIRRIKLV